MKIEVRNEKHENLLFIDCEYDKENIKQFAAILFRKSENNLYELRGSLNMYIKDDTVLDPFFIKFTGITKDFLNKYGIKLTDAHNKFNGFIQGLHNILIISHNLKGDEHILFKNGFDLSRFDAYCTWNNAHKIPKQEYFNLESLANDQGWFISSPHDAFHDAMALIPVFCGLKERIDEDKSN